MSHKLWRKNYNAIIMSSLLDSKIIRSYISIGQKCIVSFERRQSWAIWNFRNRNKFLAFEKFIVWTELCTTSMQEMMTLSSISLFKKLVWQTRVSNLVTYFNVAWFWSKSSKWHFYNQLSVKSIGQVKISKNELWTSLYILCF